MPLGAAAGDAIKELAIDALSSTCVPELFGRIWAQSGAIGPGLLPKSVHQLGIVVGTEKILHDDFLEGSLAWLEGIFQSSEIEVRTEALSIASGLVGKDESRSSWLFERSLALFHEALDFPNHDIRRTAFDFLNSISIQFQERSVSIVQPCVSFLQSVLTRELTADCTSAPLTNAIDTGYSLDLTLLDPLSQAIAYFLRERDYDGQKEGVTALTRLARALTNAPVAAELFELTIAIVESCEESEILSAAFDPLRRVFKFCHQQQPALFFEKSMALISKVMAGKIALMQDRPAPECPAFASLVQDFMDFIGQVFAASPAGVDPVCDSLLQWLLVVADTDRFSVIGALTDAVEYCIVDDHVVAAVCEYVFANWRILNDPDVQQNVAYFMALLIRTRPHSVAVVREILPLVGEWWRNGLCKKSGYEEMLANCASFFLAFAAADADAVDDALAIAAIAKFPPAQAGETAAMAEALLAVTARPAARPAAAEALARLLTETEAARQRRKLPDALIARIVAEFRALMAEQAIAEGVMALYRRKQTKAAALRALLEPAEHAETV
jgi:hypothetical protein